MKTYNKKLIYLSYSSIPSPHANSLQVMEMCHALADTGIDVALYALRTSIRIPPYQYYDLPENQVRIHHIWMPRIKIISRFLYAMCVTLSMLWRGNKGAIYGRDFYTMALIAVLPGFRQSPLFFEAHQPPSNRLEEELQNLIFKSPAFAGLVTISYALRQEYLRRYTYLSAEQIEVLPDAARPLEENEMQPVKPVSDRLALGYVGSLQDGKGMEIISSIAAQLTDYQFHVVGGTIHQISIWKKKCGENVKFHGHQPTAQVRQLTQTFDILLAPYQEKVAVGRKKIDIARWMSPLKVFEYMAAGRPMIVSDLAVLREVLQDEKNCLLADPSQTDDWVSKIDQLQNNDDLREDLGQQAYQDFMHHYTWKKRAEALDELLHTTKLNSRTPVS